MIRLKTWQQETLPTAHETSRVSDALPDHHDTHELSSIQKDNYQMYLEPAASPELSRSVLRLCKKQLVQELQFWADFQAYMKGPIPERCLCVKVLGSCRSLTGSLVLVNVLDEFEAPSRLYLNLQWMRQQATKADRPVHLALRGRSVEQPFETEDVVFLYDYVRSGDCIIADKFHF